MSQTANANPRGTPSQDHHTPSGFSLEHRPDPSNPLVSEYDWRTAPEGLATRRQLRAAGLRPGGQEPVAVLRCKACATRPLRACTRPAYLYRVDLALPVRPMTLAKEAALDKAMAARSTCPLCQRRYHHVLPLRTLGSCLECHDGTPADPATYIAPPGHTLAA